MENSILTSTKKILGIGEDYTAFDLDILTHINSSFGVLTQLGIGPETGILIEDSVTKWDDLDFPSHQQGLIRTYIYLKTRILFDPPGTSYLITATENQIKEYEWRLMALREEDVMKAKQLEAMEVSNGNV